MRKIIISIGIISVFILAIFLRFYSLANIPPGVHGDEAESGLIAEKVINYQYQSFFSLADTGTLFSFSVLNFWVQGIFLKLFGQTIFALRLSSAIAGILTISIFFLLARIVFQKRLTQLLATLALATSHWHIAYSRLALSNIWTPFFLVIIFFFFFKGMRQKAVSINFLIAGAFLGLSQYFHYTVKIIPIICILWSVIYLIDHWKKRKVAGINIFIFFIVAVFIFLPQSLYYLRHPDTYVSRIDTVSIFNHLPEYYELYHVNNIPGVLWFQFLNTMKVFNFGGDIGWYIYGYQGGLISPIAGILAVIGLCISILKFRQATYAFLLVWFFAIIILGGTITIAAPSSPRIIGVIPGLFIFVGIAVEKLLSQKNAYIKILVILLFLFNSIVDYNIYFKNYIHSQAGWAQREPATQIAYYLKSLGPDWKVYMLRENTWLYFHHGTIRFLNPNLEGIDVDNSETVIPIPETTQRNVVYIMPPNSSSLEKLQQTYHKGKARFFSNPIGNAPSFTSYEIDHAYLNP